MKIQHALIAILITGCSAFKPGELGERSVVIKPQYGAGSITTQGTVNPYTSTDINHLTLELRYLPGEALAASLDLPKAQLNLPLTFNHLMANKGYRIKFKAYKAAGLNEADVISTSGPWLDFNTTTNDAPSILTLNVRLIDKDFNGIATSSFNITNGGYSYAASESIGFLPPLVTTFAGTNQAGNVLGTLANARFTSPTKIALFSNGTMFVSQPNLNRVVKISSGTVADFLSLDGVRGLTCHPAGTTLIVTGDGAFKGYKFINTTTGDTAWSETVPESPFDVARALDDNGSDVFISLLASGLFVRDGNGIEFGDSVNVSNELNLLNPKGLLAQGDRLYIADTGHNRILKYSQLNSWVGYPFSAVELFLEKVYGDGTAGTADGSATVARFNSPKGLALDSKGNLYVSDSGNHRIRKIEPDGNVTTYAGSSAGYNDAAGTAAQFNSPDGLAVDASDNLYVVDTGNHCIRYLKRVY